MAMYRLKEDCWCALTPTVELPRSLYQDGHTQGGDV